MLAKDVCDDTENHQIEDLVLKDGQFHSCLCLWCKPGRKPGKEV